MLLPNPTQGWVKIHTTKKIEKITVYNTLGQIVKPLVEKDALDLSSLKTGLYFIEITTDEKMEIFRIIKN